MNILCGVRANGMYAQHDHAALFGRGRPAPRTTRFASRRVFRQFSEVWHIRHRSPKDNDGTGSAHAP